jgi:dTDP-4-dehydrorhamnose 3,5-epimerase
MQIDSYLNGVLHIKPKVHQDHRGHFFESFRKDVLQEFGVDLEFVQDNQSLSQKNILRGLHFQTPPYAQGKLVRVIKGAVRDVVLDIRKSSSTFGQFKVFDLTEQNFEMLYVPPGFAHGFATLEDHTMFTYKCSDYYNPESEGGVLWSSPALEIPWGVEDPVLSEKDKHLTSFSDFQSPFD